MFVKCSLNGSQSHTRQVNLLFENLVRKFGLKILKVSCNRDFLKTSLCNPLSCANKVMLYLEMGSTVGKDCSLDVCFMSPL